MTVQLIDKIEGKLGFIITYKNKQSSLYSLFLKVRCEWP